MVVFKGFEVFIKANGTALQEYENTETTIVTKDNKVIRYVECVTGSSFKIHFQALDRKFAGRRIAGIFVAIWVDGQPTNNNPCPERFPYKSHVDGRTFCQSGKTFLQKFSFGELNSDDGDLPPGTNLAKLTKEAGSWGKIGVKIYRAERFEQSAPPPEQEESSKSSEMIVNEKVLKGRPVSHTTNYAAARAIDNTYVDTIFIDRNGPFLEFEFHYMSKASLQSVGLIPRSPSPVRLEDRDTQELSREELMALVEMQRDRLQTQQVVKQEHDRRSYSSPASSAPKRKRGDRDSGEVSLVSERNVKSRKITQEPIDLTDD